jgi:hypothetical protein
MTFGCESSTSSTSGTPQSAPQTSEAPQAQPDLTEGPIYSDWVYISCVGREEFKKCEYLRERVIPKIENRIMRFSLNYPGIEYQYERCEKDPTTWGNLLKRKVKCRMVKEVYNRTSKATRQKVIDMGFKAIKASR